MSFTCLYTKAFIAIYPVNYFPKIFHQKGIKHSVAQLCLTLCDPLDCSTPGLPVHHQLPEFTQTHVHWVSDAIQPSHPQSSRSPAFNLAQHQGLFHWISSLHQVAKVLEFQLQHQSFQRIFRIDFLSDGLVGSPCSPRDSQESFPTPQFKSINSSALSFLYGPTLTSICDYWKDHSFDYMNLWDYRTSIPITPSKEAFLFRMSSKTHTISLNSGKENCLQPTVLKSVVPTCPFFKQL